MGHLSADSVLSGPWSADRSRPLHHQPVHAFTQSASHFHSMCPCHFSLYLLNTSPIAFVPGHHSSSVLVYLSQGNTTHPPDHPHIIWGCQLLRFYRKFSDFCIPLPILRLHRIIFQFSGRPYNTFFSPFYFSFTGRT